MNPLKTGDFDAVEAEEHNMTGLRRVASNSI
jgi:hypothetical protein